MHIRRDVHARPSALPRGLGDRPDLQDLQVSTISTVVGSVTEPRRVLGTPDESTWPGVGQLPDYKPTFPRWASQDLAEQVPYLDREGLDLMHVRA